MPLGNTSYLQIETMAENDNQKYLIFNDGIQHVDDAMNRLLAVDLSSGDATLTQTQLTEFVFYDVSGNAVARTLFVPTTVGGAPVVTVNRPFIVRNGGTATLTIDHTGAPGSSATLAAGETAWFYADGTDIDLVGGVGGGGDFTSLTDTPANYTGAALQVVRVNAGETGLEFAAVGGTTFTGLTDTPANYTGSGGYNVRVNVGATALEFVDEPAVPALGTGSPLDVLRINAGGTALEYTAPSAGSDFTSLTDTPANYTGAALQVVRVNAGETALEFATISGGYPVQDEGVQVVASPTAINFIGSGVTASDNGGVADINIPGAGVAWQGARVSRTTTQSIPNSSTTIIDWDQDDVDVGGWRTGTNSQFVVPTGVTRVRISCSINWDGAPSLANHEVILRLRKNGGDFDGMFRDSRTVDVTSAPMISTSGVIECVAGDIFEVDVLQTSGVAADLDFDEITWFSIEAVEGIAASAEIGFSARQNVSGSAGVQVFEIEDFDKAGDYNNTTGVFTAPVDGTYFFYAGLVENGGYTGSVNAFIRVNGADYNGAHGFHTNSGNDNHQISAVIELTAGDTVDVNTSFATAGSFQTRNYFGGFLLNSGSGGGSSDFVSLSDTPANFTGAGLQYVRVNAGETALEFVNPAFTELSDTPANFTGAALQVVRVNAGETALEFATITGGYPVQDEGVQVVASPTAINFTGSGVAASDNAGVADVNIPGAGVAWSGARVELTSNQSIPNNTVTVVDWDQVDREIGGPWWAGGNPSRLTVPSGVTKVRLKMNGVMDVSSAQFFARIHMNGASFIGMASSDMPNTADAENLNLATDVIDVVPGDYFEVEVFQTSGVAQDLLLDNRTWFSIEAVEGINGASSGIIQTIDCSASPAATYDITGIDQYDAIRIIGDDLALGSNQIEFRVSTDGGGTFLSGATDYEIGFSGSATGNNAAAEWDITGSGATSVQGFVATVSEMALAAPTTFEADVTKDNGSVQFRRRGTTDTIAVVDALRIQNSGGANFTAGNIYVIGISYGSGAGGGSAIETQDEGVQAVAATDTLNFTGSGVTATNPSGNVTEINVPGAGVAWTGARVELTADEDIGTGVFSIVDWDQVDREVGGPWWSGTNPSRLTVPSGVRRVRVKTNLEVATGGGQFFGTILMNGVSITGGGHQNTETAGGNILNVSSDVIDVVPGDYFEVEAQATSGADLSAGTDCWFSIEAVEGVAAATTGDSLCMARGTPVGGSWTVVNTGAPTQAGFADGKVTIKTNGDQGLSYIYTGVTGGADFDKVFKVRIAQDDDTVNAVGVFARNSAGAQTWVGLTRLFGFNYARQEWDNTTFQNETAQVENWGRNDFYQVQYFRIERVGTNLNYYVSSSGLDWVLVFTEALATALSGDVDGIGIYVNSTGVVGTNETGIILDGLDDGTQPALFTGTPRLFLNEDTNLNRNAINEDLAGNVVVEMNNAAANTYTVPSGLTGTEPVTIIQEGAGQTTIVAGGGVTINSAGGLLALAAQYSSAVLIPRGSDSYYLVGDLV